MKIIYTVQDPKRKDSFKRVVKTRDFVGSEYKIDLGITWTHVQHNDVVIFAVQSRNVEEIVQ